MAIWTWGRSSQDRPPPPGSGPGPSPSGFERTTRPPTAPDTQTSGLSPVPPRPVPKLSHNGVAAGRMSHRSTAFFCAEVGAPAWSSVRGSARTAGGLLTGLSPSGFECTTRHPTAPDTQPSGSAQFRRRQSLSSPTGAGLLRAGCSTEALRSFVRRWELLPAAGGGANQPPGLSPVPLPPSPALLAGAEPDEVGGVVQHEAFTRA
jgi:hypothetical protein